MVWCPYLGAEISPDATTAEHIVPLSLGGSDAFTVPVDKAENSRIGSSIEAPMTRDVLILGRRRDFNALGHSGTKPVLNVRTASYGVGRRPAQVTFHGQGKTIIWDAKDRREIALEDLADRQMELRFKINPYDRVRFVAKVALASGYEIYGDLFRRTADHNALRRVMNAATLQEMQQVYNATELRGFFELLPVIHDQQNDVARDAAMCSTVDGSVVCSVPTSGSIVFIVGVLGKWLGMINVPANTDEYPLDGVHDLGHAILLVGGRAERLSYRAYAARAFEKLTGMPAPPPPPAA